MSAISSTEHTIPIFTITAHRNDTEDFQYLQLRAV